MVDCKKCGRTLGNSKYYVGDDPEPYCPICVLGEKEGGQSKYWETSKQPNAGKPEGYRYPDDTAEYKYTWNGSKWVDKDGKTKEEKGETLG